MKVGLAGIGFMGWIHWLAYQRTEAATVAGICSRDPQKRAGDWTSIKGNFGPAGEQVDLTGVAVGEEFDALLDSDIDVIDICYPPHMHVEYCMKAIDAGKHVFCEKPLALKANECDALVAAAESKGVRLYVGQVLPYFPEYEYARQIIDSGEYGTVIGGNFKRVISDPTWIPDFYDLDRVGGPMIDLHVHDAHLIRMLFGMPEAVSSFGRLRSGVVEFCNTNFDFGDRNFAVSSTCGVINQQGRPFNHGFEIQLERGTIAFEFAVYADKNEFLPLKILDANGNVIRPDLPPGDEIAGFVSEINEVARCVKADCDSPVLGGDLARDAILLAEKQAQSVIDRNPVKI